MNTHFLPYLPLLLCPVCAQEAPAPEPGVWEHFDNAGLARNALDILHDLMLDYHYTKMQNPQSAKLPERELFLTGFRFALEKGEQATRERISTLHKARQDFVLEQLPKADFLPAHAAQPGVQKLPNGLQYDVYAAPGEAENYRARRAHRLIARVPGSKLELYVGSTPRAIDEALYDAPRGRAWRFLLPPEMLEKADRAYPQKLGLRAVEIIAVRENVSSAELDTIQQYFDSKQPPLPTISRSKPEFEREAAILEGARAALWVDADERLLARIEQLWDTYVNDSEESFKKLTEAFRVARLHHVQTGMRLTRMQHAKLTPEILDAQEHIPGTQKLPNGILYRTVQVEGLNKPLSEARFIEEEELGPEYYLRVRDRVIAETDLPDILRELAPQLPAATEWQIIIPPALRGKDYDLPLIYRLRLRRKAEKPESMRPFPDAVVL